MICPNCGFKNEPGDEFCGSCGKYLDLSAAPSNQDVAGGSAGSAGAVGTAGAVGVAGATGAGPGSGGSTGSEDPTTVYRQPDGRGGGAAASGTGAEPSGTGVGVSGSGTATGGRAGFGTGATTPQTGYAGRAPDVICWNCGRQNPAGRAFCINCGQKLTVPEGAGAGLSGAGAGGGGYAGTRGRGRDEGRGGGGRTAAVILGAIALLFILGVLGALVLGLFGSRPPGPVAVVSPSPAGTGFPSAPPTSLSGTPGPSASLALPSVVTTAPVSTSGPTIAPTIPPTPTPTVPPTATPTPRPLVPEIVRFRREGFSEPSRNVVDCTRDDFDGTIQLVWQVRNATGVELSIDGGGLYQSYDASSTGDPQVPFACEMNASHEYTLTTVGGNGPAVSVTRTITAQDPQIDNFVVTITGACGQPTPPSVTVSWQVSAATGVSLYIDDALYADYANSKSATDLPISSYDCTKPSQFYRLVTSGGYGPPATLTQEAAPA